MQHKNPQGTFPAVEEAARPPTEATMPWDFRRKLRPVFKKYIYIYMVFIFILIYLFIYLRYPTCTAACFVKFLYSRQKHPYTSLRTPLVVFGPLCKFVVGLSNFCTRLKNSSNYTWVFVHCFFCMYHAWHICLLCALALLPTCHGPCSHVRGYTSDSAAYSGAERRGTQFALTHSLPPHLLTHR